MPCIKEPTLLTLRAPALVTVDDCRTLLGGIADARAQLDLIEARALARLDELADNGEGPGGRESALLDGRRSSRQARNAHERSRILAAVPQLSAALETGAVTSEHVDAYTAGCRDLTDAQRAELLDDPDLHDAAVRLSADPFRTLVRNRAAALRKDDPKTPVDQLKRHVKRDGTHVFSGTLNARDGARLFNAIDAEIDTLAQTQRAPKTETTAALALARLADRGLGAGPNPAAPEVIVVDAGTLTNGPHDHTVCETESGAPLAVATVERVMCNAVIMPTLINTTTGDVLHLGRTQRIANRSQRRALRAMYPSCAFPGCSTAFTHCQMHHIHTWHEGGATDLDNLIPLCSHHHHLVHEGRWRIRLGPDRTLHIHQPNGQHFTSEPLPSAELAQGLAKRRDPERPPTEAPPQSDARQPRGRPPDRPTHNRAA